jgi:hypothetical protein
LHLLKRLNGRHRRIVKGRRESFWTRVVERASEVGERCLELVADKDRQAAFVPVIL